MCFCGHGDFTCSTDSLLKPSRTSEKSQYENIRRVAIYSGGQCKREERDLKYGKDRAVDLIIKTNMSEGEEDVERIGMEEQGIRDMYRTK